MRTFPRLRSELLYNRLDDQILVYDRRTDRVHLLDSTTASALERLRANDGTHELVNATVDAESSPASALLELALEELRKADLLEEDIPAPSAVAGVNRRDLLRKVAAGAACALIPAIVTLSPSLLHGQGTVCLAKKECCTVDADCCSNKCDASTGTGCTTGPLECH